MPDKFIVFDVWGDYAHFKRYYTTASPLTFSIPPRTTVIGLVSAIIGLGKSLFGTETDEYLNFMTKDKAYIAVRLLNSIKKIRWGLNLIDTKGGETNLDHWWIKPRREGQNYKTGRTQIRFEFLKDPRYRIYFSHRDPELHKKLLHNLREHKSFYTPYLGISELIANFEYVGEYNVSKLAGEDDFLPVITVLPLDAATLDTKKLLEPGNKFFKERVPVEMQPGRVVTEYREVLYESEGKPIYAKAKGAFVLENGECIVTL